MNSKMLVMQALNLLNTNQTGLAQRLGIDKGLVSKWVYGRELRYCYVLAIYGLLVGELGKDRTDRFMGDMIRY